MSESGYTVHLHTRSEERLAAAACDPAKRPRRYVVERLHSWLNRSRRLLVRWVTLARTFVAFMQLACALLCAPLLPTGCSLPSGVAW